MDMEQQLECPECVTWGLWSCIEGEVYGPCSYEECYGICELVGECDCVCHEQ